MCTCRMSCAYTCTYVHKWFVCKYNYCGTHKYKSFVFVVNFLIGTLYFIIIRFQQLIVGAVGITSTHSRATAPPNNMLTSSHHTARHQLLVNRMAASHLMQKVCRVSLLLKTCFISPLLA